MQDIVVRYPQLAEWQAELLVTLRPLFVELVRCRPNDIVCQEEVQERIVKIVLEHVDKLQDVCTYYSRVFNLICAKPINFFRFKDEETAGAWEEVNEAVQKCLE